MSDAQLHTDLPTDDATPEPVSAIRHVNAADHQPAFRPRPSAGDRIRVQDELRSLSTTTVEPSTSRGLRGALRSLGIPLPPSAAEEGRASAERARVGLEAVIRTAKWSRGVGVLVANPRGGVGKTPTALLLGGMLAHIRGGDVAVLEVTDEAGSLSYRSEGESDRGLGELVRDVDRIERGPQLQVYAAKQSSYASVFGTVGSREPLTDEDVARVAGLIDSFYELRVMDSGAQTSSSAFRGALEVTDALVIPVLRSADAVLAALALLDQLRVSGRGDLVETATIVRVTDGRPEQPAVVARLNGLIADAGAARVIDVPFDRHIAERGPLSLDRLSPAASDAHLRLASAVVDALAGVR